MFMYLYYSILLKFSDMQAYQPSFRENFHMEEAHFNHIFSKIKAHIEPNKISRPDVIKPEIKLAAVLEYLSCGSLQRHIASNYRISKQAMAIIIDQVCDGIIIGMKDEIPCLSKDGWRPQINSTQNGIFQIVWELSMANMSPSSVL